MVPLQGECQAISSFLGGGVCWGRGCIELYPPLPTGYVLLSPRQSRSPQLNTALCKSLKYPTCTALVVVLVVMVQKQTKLASSFCPSEPHFLHAAEYGNYVYFFYREIAVEQSSLGKVRQCTSCL